MPLGLIQAAVAAEAKAGVNEGLVRLRRSICLEEGCVLITTQNRRERCMALMGAANFLNKDGSLSRTDLIGLVGSR